MAPPKIKPQGIFEIFTDFKGKGLYTKALNNDSETHFGERILKDGGQNYRSWEAKRSKLAAYVLKGCPNTGIRKGSVVLYLGASHGHTPSYVSDMVGSEGFVFCLDFAPRVVRDLVFLCKKRENMAPIMADAHHPNKYVEQVSEVDVVFQDIAQKDQAEIFLRNCRAFLKEGGVGLLAVKAKSINIKKDPKQIFEEVRAVIGEEFMITDMRTLEPFELDHCMIVIKKKAPVEETKVQKAEGSRRSRNQDRNRNFSSKDKGSRDFVPRNNDSRNNNPRNNESRNNNPRSSNQRNDNSNNSRRRVRPKRR